MSRSDRHRLLLGAALGCSVYAGNVQVIEKVGSSGRTRTYNPPVNSRMLCQLSYSGNKRRRSAPLLSWRRVRATSSAQKRYHRCPLADNNFAGSRAWDPE